MKILCGKFLQPWEETLIEFQSRPSLSLHLLDSPCQQHQHDNAMVTMVMKTKIMCRWLDLKGWLLRWWWCWWWWQFQGASTEGWSTALGSWWEASLRGASSSTAGVLIFSRCFDFYQVLFSGILIFFRHLDFLQVFWFLRAFWFFSGVLIFCRHLDCSGVFF